jgi:O-antigen/teichoic acid export membrane protein
MLKEESLAQKFLKKGFWLYVFTFLIWPLWYTIKVILSENLTVAEIGMIYGVLSFVSLIAAYNDLWCTESLNYFLPKHILKNDYGRAKYLLKITLFSQVISSLLIVSILLYFAPFLATQYFNEPKILDIFSIATLYFIGINIFEFSSILFSVSQNTKLQKWTEFLRFLSTAIGVSILAFFDIHDAKIYMWCWIIGLFLWAIIATGFAYFYYYKPYFSGIKSIPSREERNEFFRYALATLFTTNMSTILSQVDMQMIIFLLGTEQAWYYANYLSLYNIPFLFITPIIGFLFPVIAELHSRQNIEKMKLLWGRFSLYLTIAWIWIGGFLFQYWPHLSLLFFWEKFLQSGKILLYSAPFIVFNLLLQINIKFLIGTGNVKKRAQIILIVIPCNIFLNWIGIITLWVYGSAIVCGITWMLLWYLTHRVTTTYHSSIPFQPIILNILGVFWTMFLLSFFLHNWVMRMSRMEVFADIFIAVLVNFTIFCFMNFSLLKEGWSIVRTTKS